MKQSIMRRVLVVLTIAAIGVGAAAPAGAGDRGSQISDQAPGRGSMREAVHVVLVEAGLSPGKATREREERLARGLARLVDAGIIDEAKVAEFHVLVEEGRLGRAISEMANAAATERRAAATERRTERRAAATERRTERRAAATERMTETRVGKGDAGQARERGAKAGGMVGDVAGNRGRKGRDSVDEAYSEREGRSSGGRAGQDQGGGREDE